MDKTQFVPRSTFKSSLSLFFTKENKSIISEWGRVNLTFQFPGIFLPRFPH